MQVDWLRSKAAAIGVGCLAIIGIQSYSLMSVRSTLENRLGSVEQELAKVRSENNTKSAQLTSDLTVITNRMGITAQELERAHSLTEQLKQENARTTQRLRNELAAKADARAVSKAQQEAQNRLAEVQQDATTKIGAVSGDVQVVRADLDATRQDLASSRKDIVDVRSEIARNAGELAELRRKGERDYYEFDIRKGKEFERIADVRVILKKTDVKRQKYDVTLQVDDSRIEKKDRTANEPVQFLIGRDRLRYELVVNYVDKDRIRGYIDTVHRHSCCECSVVQFAHVVQDDVLVLVDHVGQQGIEAVTHRDADGIVARRRRNAVGTHTQQQVRRFDPEPAPPSGVTTAKLGIQRSARSCVARRGFCRACHWSGQQAERRRSGSEQVR